MEAGDLPLVTPLQDFAFKMFDDDLSDLARLQGALNAVRPSATPQRVVTPVVEDAPAQTAQGGKGGKGAASPGGKKGGKAPAPVVPTPPRTPPPGLAEAPTPAPVDFTNDPFLTQTAALEAQLQAHVAACAPFRDFTEKRLAFFATKPAEKYLIEEVLCEWDTQPEHIPSSCIDAVTMSRDHAANMTSKYSYVPPRGLHVAGQVRPEDVPDPNRHPDLLQTHEASGAGMDKEPITKLFSPRDPPPAPNASSLKKSRNAGTAMMNASQNSQMFGATMSDFNGSNGAAATFTKSAAPPKAKSVAVSPQTKRLQSVRGGGVPDLIVETSLDSFVFLDCFPGTQYELTCRVWNRDTSARRFKLVIKDDPRKLLKYDVLTPGFSTEVAVVPGHCFDVRVTYSPLDTAPLAAVLHIGHARDVNRVDAESNKLSQWQYHEMEVRGTSLAPELEFPGLQTEFQPCFIGAHRQLQCTVRNRGSAGTILLRSSCESLEVSHPVLTLGAGEEQTVAFTYTPVEPLDLVATVSVLGFLPSQRHDDPQESPVSESELTFSGKCVVPDVRLEAFCDAELPTAPLSTVDGRATPAPSPAPGTLTQLPYVVIKDACVGFTSTGRVRVSNHCALPVSVAWQIEAVGPATLRMSPATHTLKPDESAEFTLSLLPSSGGPAQGTFESIVSLMLLGVPRPAAALAARLRGTAVIKPQLKDASDRVAVPKDVDPFGLFSPRLITRDASTGPKTGRLDESTAEHTDELSHFCAAVRVVADPVPPSATVTPTVILNDAPCLLLQPNVRQVVFVNTSPRDIPFWIDPPTGADHPRELLRRNSGAGSSSPTEAPSEKAAAFAKLFTSTPLLLNQRHDVDVVFTPSRFTIKGGQSKTVTMTFTAKRAGPVNTTIECFSTLLDPCPTISLSAIGRGPELTLSTQILEYGVIPVGGEAEGRLTLTNNNPIPVVFSLLDMHASDASMTVSFEMGKHRASPAQPLDSDRMVFLPSAGTLRPRESRDITIYVRGHAAGALQDKIRIAVEDGVSSYVQVRASVQQPRACVTPAAVCLPVVERNVPAKAFAYASNLSAVDMDFNIVPVDVPDSMSVQIVNPSGLLHAGAADVPIEFSVTFSGLRPGVAVMALESSALEDPVVFEITCGRVSQLAIAVSVATVSKPRLGLSVDSFCERVVENIISAAFMEGEHRTVLDEAQVTDPITAANYAAPLNLAGVIDTVMPFCMETATVTVTNNSGCYATLSIKPDVYPAPSIVEGAEDLKGATMRSNASTTTKSVDPVPVPGRLAPLDATIASNKSGAAKSAATNTRRAALALTSGTAGKTFTCKAINGMEAQENEEKRILADAQLALTHGAGFAVSVDCVNVALDPYQTIEVPVKIFANIPGAYRDNLRIQISDMPPTIIPIKYHIEGKAIVVDPFTSGLSVGPLGIATLLMPPLVSGMPAVKRTLTLTSRCPRELLINAKILEWGKAITADVSEECRLRITDLSPDGESSADCAATVAPTSFTLPALQTKAIVLEYMPPSSAMTKGFHASLIVTSTPAQCHFNDRFFIDEFYKLNASRFPASRSLAPASVIAKEGIMVRGVPKITLRTPLVDRSGVVASTSIMAVADDALLAAERMAAKSAGGSSTGGAAHPDDDSDDDKASHRTADDAQLIARMKAQRDKHRAQGEERNELLQFIDARRADFALAWKKHVRTVEIELHVTHLNPKLVTDPPDELRLPLCRRSGVNSRSIVLSNEGAAPVDFKLQISSGPFRVVRTLFRAENKGTAVDFSMSKLAQSVKGRPTSRDSNPTQTLFRLRPADVLDVTVELVDLGNNVKHDTTGSLQIAYADGSSVQEIPLTATVHVPTVETDTASIAFRPTVAITGGKKQPVYRRMLRLINTSLCPARFSIRHDPADRPLSFNTVVASKAAVMKSALGSIAAAAKPSAAPGAPDLRSSQGPLKTVRALGTLGGAAEANVVSVGWTDEAEANPVDDPSRFIFQTTEGVIEPATAGSVPTVLEIPVTFEEHAMTYFESRFAVEIEGGVGCSFTLVGESRRTEL